MTVRQPLQPYGPLVAAVLAALLIGAVLVVTSPPDERRGAPEQAERDGAEAQAERHFPRLKLVVRSRGGNGGPQLRDLLDASSRLIVGRFDEVALLSRDSPAQADYLLSLDLVKDQGATRVFASLERAAPGVVVWSQDIHGFDWADSVDEFIGAALSPILSPYGVLYADVAERADDDIHFDCVAIAYRYFDQETWEGRLKSQKCLEELIAEGVRHPTIFALKTYLHLDAYRSSKISEFDGDAPLEKALEAARNAVAFSPASARGKALEAAQL